MCIWSLLLDEVISINENIDVVSDIAVEITEIVKENDTVDWQNNQTIHNKIAQQIDDLFYEYEKEYGFKLDFDVIDKIMQEEKLQTYNGIFNSPSGITALQVKRTALSNDDCMYDSKVA